MKLIAALLFFCGAASASFNYDAFRYSLGELVYVKIGDSTVCRGYVAEAVATEINRYRISPIICRGMEYYNVWVNENDISK